MFIIGILILLVSSFIYSYWTVFARRSVENQPEMFRNHKFSIATVILITFIAGIVLVFLSSWIWGFIVVPIYLIVAPFMWMPVVRRFFQH